MSIVSKPIAFNDLDPRLLWNKSQRQLTKVYHQLFEKCEAGENRRGYLFILDEAKLEHLIAIFNLAMAHSFEDATLLTDGTGGAWVSSRVLAVPADDDVERRLVNERFMLLNMDSSEFEASHWPHSVNQYVGHYMLAIMTTKRAAKLDWERFDQHVAVVALTDPGDLEAERWTRLAELVGDRRFAGVWVVD